MLEVLGERFIDTAAAARIEGPQVVVRERRTRAPLAGAEVLFRLGQQAGSQEIARVVTNEHGIASPGKWNVPQRSGTYALDVFASGSRTSLQLRVRAGAPALLSLSDSSIAGIAGEEVPGPVLLLFDAYGNRASGNTVSFEVLGGGGSIAQSVAVSDTDGRVSAGRWRLGPSAGENLLIVRAQGVEPVTIRTPGFTRSSLDWFALEAVNLQQPVPPDSVGIARSTLGFTRFDPCLCRNEEGYFVVEIETEALHRMTVSGRFRVEPPRLRIRGDFGYPWGGTSPEPLYWIGDQYRSPEADRLVLEIYRWYPEWWEWWPQMWSYRKER